MNKKKKRRITALAVIAAVTVLLICWTFLTNRMTELNIYTLTSDSLPKEFSGFRVAQVSDLHIAETADGNEKIISLLREAEPDMIAVTGDLIDSRDTDLDIALRFVNEALKIAPCYYVTGNHEARIPEYADLREGMTESGVVVLEDARTEIERSGQSIAVLGVNDPSFGTDYLFGDSATVMQNKLQNLIKGEDTYTLLLSHRPELFGVYVEYGVDLVLSGHAHGGQFRLPFVGGMFAPNQGLFPKYDSGLYTSEDTNMIVSRGIGDSIIPFRFNNPPEVVVIELKAT